MIASIGAARRLTWLVRRRKNSIEMERRTFARTLAAMLCVLARAGTAQQGAKIPVVGFLTLAGADSFAQFREAMRDLGYIDGQNIIFERRSSAGRPEPLRALATGLVQLKVDVLYATGPAAVRAAHEATRGIPVVAFDLETDPVDAGLVRSLNRPGGNLTGLFLDLPDLAGKWLDLLHEAAPETKAISILWDSTTGSAQLRAARSAAHRLALDIELLEIRNSSDLDRALTRAKRGRAVGLVVLSSPLVSGNSPRIAEFALRQRLPAISAFRAFADSGGLLLYGPNLVAFRRFAATYIDKILKGAKPADLPIQQPNTSEFIVNLRTATSLGLTIPQALLLRADEVIK